MNKPPMTAGLIAGLAAAGGLAAVGGIVGGGVAAAQPLPPSEPPGLHAQALGAPDFVIAATQADQFERQEGELAATRATDPRIRTLAHSMIGDQGGSTRAIRAAAHAQDLPTSSPGLSLAQQAMLTRLQAAHGPEFDRTYVDQQVRAHEATLSLMTSYAKNGRPGPLRRAAVRIGPIVRRHLARFERLQRALR